ncbi:hypothetical protein BOTBODRAFT_42425 [Botryobasidium botryosum FD-172 SS1]|uniref:Peptidase A1 domain-containing protein n=1 Tax=Botryobasidium botryosum (strain FD-172 SS1) TaxID=930990 RepID=A0A067MQE2_BOTB1|nr:hypothetical protein BOTBODRAFT_42425 [Botryobasidium botryosum FD-172 SS1]
MPGEPKSGLVFKLDLDTGSSDFFVPGQNCSNCGNQASSTSRNLGKNHTIEYSNDSVSTGGQFSDMVSVAGLTATGQTFGVATNSTALSYLGLAYPSISVFYAPRIFNTLMAQNKVAHGVFSFFLAENDSEVFFGGYNEKRFMGDISWNNVTEPAWWQIKLDVLSVGGRAAVTEIQAVIDSGTSYIWGDRDMVKEFYAQIPESQVEYDGNDGILYHFPCKHTPKDVSLTFSNKTVVIDQKWFNTGTVPKHPDRCYGAIAAVDDDSYYWIVGDVFMRNTYTIFDFDHQRVGFATLAA